MLAAVVTTYCFSWRIISRVSAQWTAALMITLSAFVNTGKTVLGEIPAFFFLMAGLFTFERVKNPWTRGFVSGIFFGLAIVTKITFAIVLPALLLVCVTELLRRRFRDMLSIMVSGVVTILVCIPWRLLEIFHTPMGSLTDEIGKFVLGGGDMPLFFVLRETPELLVRLPFLAFAVIAFFGFLGFCRTRTKSETRIVIGTMVVLFMLYFINGPGWYRHLLPAHLLLLPFVPAGMVVLLHRRIAAALLSLIILLQGMWQLMYRGAGQGTALAETVAVVKSEYAETDLLIEQAEVFVQLPRNPHWLFLIRDRVSPTMPEQYMNPTGPERCWKHLRKLNSDELAFYAKKAVKAGNAYVVPPPANCR
jgi:4-amino-4-deoxy-L-arabinose transferase-like glycosyltransferase